MYADVRQGIRVQYSGVSIAIYGRLQHLPKLSRVHYGMDTIGLKSGRVQTQDPGGNRRLWLSLLAHILVQFYISQQH